ncbi:MAG TPA: YHYH protein [Phycisphaerae bacterium]|nr:YHYH protein [Phycisphaerae bacterium]HRW51874.1 YHYH protein [Phycisphaerae bacterium]
MTRPSLTALALALTLVITLGSQCESTSGVTNTNANTNTNTSSNTNSNDNTTDITDAVFTNMSGTCVDYAGAYTASVMDVGESASFTATIVIVDNGDSCTVTSNSIPNHDFNNGGSFATRVAEVNETFTLDATPELAATPTALSLEYDNAIMLNGVKLDLLAAACYGVGNEPLGQEKIGCFDSDSPWRYDPMFSGNNFGTDSHHAHTQPDGAYHYHGDPLAMYDTSGATASPVIGFAADGFPIYGPYINDNGVIRKVLSGYTLKSGARVSQSGEGAFPGGTYDGTFIDDWEWTGAGDLDECNGMMYDGSYAYFVTDSYPWVIRCFSGAPDPSFRKQP